MAEILRWGEIERAVEVVEELFDDPKTLRPFADRLRERAREFVQGEGEGAWTPPAASTLKKWESTGTSDITKRGNVRQAKLDRLQSEMDALKRRTAKSGWGEKDRKRAASLLARLERLQEQRTKAQGKRAKLNAARGKVAVIKDELRAAKSAKRAAQGQSTTKQKRAQAKVDRLMKRLAQEERATQRMQIAKIGKRVAEVRQNRLMPRMAGTIRASVKRTGDGELTVTTYSRSGEVGLWHHTGTGKDDPQRTIVPEPSEDDMAFLIDLLEGRVAEVIDGETS
jgi:hypothetical protein